MFVFNQRNVLLFIAVMGLSSSALADRVADYRFRNNYQNTNVGAPGINSVGMGQTFATEVNGDLDDDVLVFPSDTGLALASTGVVPDDVYTIYLIVKLDFTTSYRKLVDFSGGTLDDGLYSQNGNLRFYPIASGTGQPITTSAYARVAVTRDRSNNFIGYVNGVEQFSFVDTDNQAVIGSNQLLRFLIDDELTGSEESSGRLARLVIFDRELKPDEIQNIDDLLLFDGMETP